MYAKMKKLQAKTQKMSTFSNREEKRRIEKSKEETTTSSRAREGEKSIICYFWLDPKVTKRSRLRLLRYSLPTLLRSNSDAPGRSVTVVRLTLTSRGRSYPASPSASGLRITSFLHVKLSGAKRSRNISYANCL